MEVDFYHLAKIKNFKNEDDRHRELQKTLKYVLSNIRKICRTNEYNVAIIDIAYLFEHIRNSLVYVFSLFLEKDKREAINKCDWFNFDWNVKLFNEIKKFHVPDFIYWLFLCVPYYYRDNLDKRRQIFEKMLDYLFKSWPSEMYFKNKEFMFMTENACVVYPLAYHGLSDNIILSKYSKLMRKICPDLNYVNPNLSKIKWKYGDKIKVCFLSDTLTYDTSVLRDRMGIITRLPQHAFDIYYCSTKDPNNITEKISKVFYNKMKDKYIQIDKDLNKARERLIKENFHIIVYPDIGMRVFQTFLAYSRLAPIQINTWGHSSTSGIDTIDYYITSKFFEVENLEEVKSHYSEIPIMMDSLSTFYFEPSKMFCGEGFKFKDRKHFGFKDDDHIYWCMQTFYKYSEEFERTLANILKRDPKGKLLMTNTVPFCRSHLQRIENLFGEAIKQIVFYPVLEKEKFLNLVRISDVVLDPFPFGGCNTSLEAFEANIPVVALPSRVINGRFTYGFYKKMGVSDCIVDKSDDYVELALKITHSPEYRKAIVKKIENNKGILFKDGDSIKEWSQNLQDIVARKFT